MLKQNELFRKEALGNFGRLTKAVSFDPAMMLYLDFAQSNKKKPNENFARELFELFTLGEGNYTETDIARIVLPGRIPLPMLHTNDGQPIAESELIPFERLSWRNGRVIFNQVQGGRKA